MLGAHVYNFTRAGRPGLIIAVTFPLDSASLVHCIPYGIPRSLHHMTATKAEKVAAVVQHQNVQHRSPVCPVLCAAIAAASAVI